MRAVLILLSVFVVIVSCRSVNPHVRRRLRRPPLHLMTDVQLCCAWRTTTVALHVMRAGPQQLAIATRRREYLDEMEARNAAGFRAWLETGDAADDALEGFLVRDRRAGT